MNLADDPTLHLSIAEHADDTSMEHLPSTATRPPYRAGRIGEVVDVDADLLITPGMP